MLGIHGSFFNNIKVCSYELFSLVIYFMRGGKRVGKEEYPRKALPQDKVSKGLWEMIDVLVKFISKFEVCEAWREIIHW